MKMPKEMWFPIVGFFYSAGEASKPELYDFLVKTEQLEYLYLKDPNEELDYEVTWDIATKLENLDLETDEKMRDLFFGYFNFVSESEKKRIYRNTDSKVFTKEVKQYYINHMIKYPSIFDLYYFRKNITTKQMEIGLMNFINQKTNEETPYEKFWDNYMNAIATNKLLELLGTPDLSKELYESYSKIKFLSKYKQLQFNNLANIGQEKKQYIEMTEAVLYNFKVVFNKLEIIKTYPELNGKMTDEITSFIEKLFKYCIELREDSHDQILNSHSNGNYMLSYLTDDKQLYEKNKKKIDLLEKEILNLVPQIIIEIKQIDRNYDEVLKNFADKVMFKHQLNNNMKEDKKTKSKIKI